MAALALFVALFLGLAGPISATSTHQPGGGVVHPFDGDGGLPGGR